MEAFEYLKELKRMCESFTGCKDCPLCDSCDILHSSNEELQHRADVVEKWSKEHPIKTYQKALLEIFPNAPMIGGVITLCPKIMDCSFETCTRSCSECRKQFWLTPINTNDMTEEAK